MKLRGSTSLLARTCAAVVSCGTFLPSSHCRGYLPGMGSDHRQECCRPGISFLLHEIACGLFVCPECQSESSKAHLECHDHNL